MKTVVVYESMFGNTKAIAEAIAQGLGEAGEVTLGSESDVDLYKIRVVPGARMRFDLDAAEFGSSLNTQLRLFNRWLLFVGTLLDLSPALIIFTPILLPIAIELGVDPVHFGVIMVVNLAIGLFTPPVGVCLFVACGIAGISITDSIRALIPFFLGLVAVLLIVTYVPPAVMLIPNALMP